MVAFHPRDRRLPYPLGPPLAHRPWGLLEARGQSVRAWATTVRGRQD